MNKNKLLFILSLMVFWYFLALHLDNEIILPNQVDVLTYMIGQLFSVSFYQVVLATFSRMLLGLTIAVFTAIILATLSSMFKWVKDISTTLVSILQAIPNISFIIILLIWFGSNTSVIIVSLLVLFPIFFQSILTGISSIEQQLKDVYLVYPVSRYKLVTQVYIPQVKFYLLGSLKVAVGLGFKVSVMAEILTQVSVGIGRQMNYSRNMLDMAALFSWTIWIIIISLALDKLIDKIKEKVMQ